MQHDDIRPPWRLDCSRLSVCRRGRPVLHEVELSIPSGECLTLIGPNGSGKTSLMLALLGLLRPSAGHVRVAGRDVASLPAKLRGRFAAFVPQTIERLPAFRVFDVVAAGRYPHLTPMQPLSAQDEAIVAQMLARCGLEPLADRPINAVSGGERQKALLAAAMAQDAQVMLLDEPNTALDPAYQVELVRLLRGWHAEGRTIVLISHDLHLPAVLGGRVAALRGGRLVADGSAEEVLRPERLEAIYRTEFDLLTAETGRRVIVPRW